MFTITGQVDGSERSVTWVAPDVLEGDPGLIAAAWEAVTQGLEVRPMPTSVSAVADLAEPFVALITLAGLFDSGGYRLDGEPPEVPERFAFTWRADVIY